MTTTAKRQPRTFYTSDLHLGHESVAVRHRGFASVIAHDEAVIAAWSDVAPQDTVCVLGDIIGRHDRAPYALGVLSDLPGRKHLIAGNHDPVHPMHRRTFARELPAWLEVFDSIAPFARRKLAGHEVLLQHFPYAAWGDGPQRGPARYLQYRLPDLGLRLLHGHTHGQERAHGTSLHVGLDAWPSASGGFELVPQETVIDWLEARGEFAALEAAA